VSPLKVKSEVKLEVNLTTPPKREVSGTPPVIKGCRKKINSILLKDKSMSKGKRDRFKNVTKQIASKDKSLCDSLVDNEDEFTSLQDAVDFTIMMVED